MIVPYESGDGSVPGSRVPTATGHVEEIVEGLLGTTVVETACYEGVPGDGVAVRHSLEESLGAVEVGVVPVRSEDGVPGDGVARGHFVEQLAGGMELTDAAEGGDPAVVMKELGRGESAATRLGGGT